MGLFNRSGKTAADVATEEFEQAYAGFPEGTRASVVALLAELWRQTRKPCFEQLAEPLAVFIGRIVPSMADGTGGATVICAIEKGAPTLRADLGRALGEGFLKGEIERAASALR